MIIPFASHLVYQYRDGRLNDELIAKIHELLLARQKMESLMTSEQIGSSPLNGGTKVVLRVFPECEQEHSKDVCLEADCSARFIHYEA